MLPAQQGFHTDNLASAHIHLGLIMQHEFVMQQRLPQALQLSDTTLHLLVADQIKQMITTTPTLLGLTHGLIGMTQQNIGIGIIQRIQRHPDTAGHSHRDIPHCNGFANDRQHSLQQRVDFIHLTEPVEQHHKFVAPQSRHCILRPYGVNQTRSHFHQNRVAHFMTVTIIDRFELIQIKQTHRRQRFMLSRVDKRPTETVLQQISVR